jgi:hypothetical protein
MSETVEHDKPMVLRNTLLACQACVPHEWTNDQAQTFVNIDNPTGIESHWRMRKNGSELLGGCAERVPCEGRAGFVHIMFDC